MNVPKGVRWIGPWVNAGSVEMMAEEKKKMLSIRYFLKGKKHTVALGRSPEALAPEVVAFLVSGFATRFVVGAEVGVAAGRPRSLSFSLSSSSSSSSSLALMASNLASVQSITRPIVIPPPSISSDGPVTPPAETPCWMKLSMS